MNLAPVCGLGRVGHGFQARDLRDALKISAKSDDHEGAACLMARGLARLGMRLKVGEAMLTAGARGTEHVQDLDEYSSADGELRT